MTAGVNTAMATTSALAPARSSRQAETSPDGFDEALGMPRSRTAHAVFDAGAKSQSPQSQRSALQADAEQAADNSARVTEIESEGALEEADPQVGEELGAIGSTDEEPDADKEGDADDEGSSLPARMKAEHAISALMALVPQGPIGQSDKGSGDKETRDESGTTTGSQTSKAALSVDQTNNAKASNAAAISTGTQADAASSPLAKTSAHTTPSPVAGTSNDAAASTGAAGEQLASGESKAPQETAKTVKSADAPREPSTTANQAATSSQQEQSPDPNGEGSKSNAGTRGQHEPASDKRQAEPQPVAAKVTVVAQQAAPAPAPVLNANTAAIVSAIDANQTWRPMASTAGSAPTNAQPMHSLKIQLHPVELGVVTANLKAAGDQLSVELHVENQDAYNRLNADRDAIVKSLRTLGYDIEHVSIQQPQQAATNVARADASAATGSFSRDASSFQPGNSDGGGERFGGQTSGRGDRGDGQRNDQAQPAHQNRTSGGIYI